MPYTPPTKQSPVASRPQTPSLNNNNSQSPANATSGQGTLHDQSRPSSSYLSKHRRSPSISSTPPNFQKYEAFPEDEKSGTENLGGTTDRPARTDQTTHNPDESIENSPSLSPPSSGDDEVTERRGRQRDGIKLAELQAAIRIIEQHRTGSPPDAEACEVTKKARTALGLPGPRLDTSNKAEAVHTEISPRLPLTARARKITHSRSTTDASAFFDFPRIKLDSPGPSASQSDDDDIDDEELEMKPGLIRKKSGELVRPALRASSLKRRPSSMPGTPTYAKAVHFQDNSLEHVRHFLQVDRPIAVSASSSPVDPHDDDVEFPLGIDGSSSPSSPYEWEIRMTNFSRNVIEREALPVRTEKVYLSADTKVLIGRVAVRNLAFHKFVVARFTLDFWKTTSEVVAEFDNDVQHSHTNDGCDRFTFNIKLEDQANLESKTMFFCIKYHVNGQDYWDNNNSTNYQVDFSKRFKSRRGKQGLQGKSSTGAVPRNKLSPAPRPRSMPSFDDFSSLASPFEFSSFPQPSTIIGDSPIRFKNKPSTRDMLDTPGRPKVSANQQAFGNRYDFGASLSAAIQFGSTGMGPQKDNTKPSAAKSGNKTPPTTKVQSAPGPGNFVNGSNMGHSDPQENPKPTALVSEKPSLSSSSYHELLDKYCFFGSGKPSSQPTKPVPSQLDGASHDSPGSGNVSGKISSPPTGLEISITCDRIGGRIENSVAHTSLSISSADADQLLRHAYPYRNPWLIKLYFASFSA